MGKKRSSKYYYGKNTFLKKFSCAVNRKSIIVMVVVWILVVLIPVIVGVVSSVK